MQSVASKYTWSALSKGGIAIWLLLGVALVACSPDDPEFARQVGPPDERDAGRERDAGPGVRNRFCGDVDCGLHGDCQYIGDHGSCVCDVGYKASPGDPGADGVCIEDLDCVKARILECRTGLRSSAIGAHLSLQYCSGKPYTGLAEDHIIVEEQGVGNDDFIELLPDESFASIIPSDPLMHIYVVIDVSNSILNSDILGDLGAALQQFVDQLEGMGGQFRVAVFLFDGRPYLYPFIVDTSDLGAVRTELDALAIQMGEDPSSSNVYGAVIGGINALRRTITLRNLVNDLGTLSTGTLIVVSDGDDRSSTRTLDQVTAAIDQAQVNILTVGLGDVANYPILSSIGRDGSYSAPVPAQLDKAFEQIGDRIGEQRESLYLIGYCSPKRVGKFTTRVGILDLVLEGPTCAFDASGFVGGTCSADSLKREVACAGIECGGVLGCGVCAEGQCCEAGICMAPSSLPATATCGAEWMCAPGTTCVLGKCIEPSPPGGYCGSDAHCDWGEQRCEPTESSSGVPFYSCLPALQLGDPCTDGHSCQSLSCGVPVNEPGAAMKECLPASRMFEKCDPGKIVCEAGSYCLNKVCVPQKNAGSCKIAAECKSGNCAAHASGDKACTFPDMLGPACLFTLAL